MLEVCHTIAINIDRNRMLANRLNVEYTLDLAVRNVERLNVSSFVMGVHMSVLLIWALSKKMAPNIFTHTIPIRKVHCIIFLYRKMSFISR